MTDDDGRNGFPSASAGLRLSLCPASHRLSAGLQSRGSEYASFGDEVAENLDRLYHCDFALADNEAAEVALRLHRRTEEELTKLCDRIGAEVVEGNSERRFWYELDGKGRRMSAKPDRFYRLSDGPTDRFRWETEPGSEREVRVEVNANDIEGRRGVIFDHKGIRWGEHDDSDENQQSRIQALAVAQEENLDTVYACILQDGHPVKWVRYGTEDLDDAVMEWSAIYDRIEDPDEKPTPGEAQCKFCPAAEHVVCPAINSKLGELTPHQLVPLDLRTDEELAVVDHYLPGVEKIIAGYKAEIRRRVEADPDAWERRGYVLAPSGVTRTIKDPGLVYDRLVALGNDLKEVAALGTMPITPVRKMAGKNASAVLSGAVEEKPKRPSLKRVKALPATE